MIEIAEKFVEARYTYEGKQYEEVDNIFNAVSPYVCQDYYERLKPILEINGQGTMMTPQNFLQVTILKLSVHLRNIKTKIITRI